MRERVGKTHPWLTAGSDSVKSVGDLNGLCSEEFLRKMKEYGIAALPGELDDLKLKYTLEGNTLGIIW
jgi:hypothetical protein